MDAWSSERAADAVVVSGAGVARREPDGTEPDVRPWLVSRKTRKFMGKQDRLAVVAAGRALEAAGLLSAPRPRAQMGLYLTASYVPFERADVAPLVRHSGRDGVFSMARFSGEAMAAMNPLLTFRCLPNMPAFHVSLALGIRGPYLVSYPGAGQLYRCLLTALADLASGAVRSALVGGVADQQNFLVRHHLARLGRDVDACGDAAAFLLLERATDAAARSVAVLGRCEQVRLDYQPVDPLGPLPDHVERMGCDGGQELPLDALGPASLPYALATRGPVAGVLHHELRAQDGLWGRSRWAWAP